MSTQPIRVTIWNENVHEKQEPSVAKLYTRTAFTACWPKRWRPPT